MLSWPLLAHKHVGIAELWGLGYRQPPCPLICGARWGAPVFPSEPLPWWGASGFSMSVCPWALSLPTAISQPRTQASIHPVTEWREGDFECHEPLSSWGFRWHGSFSGIWICMSAHIRVCSVFIWIAHMCSLCGSTYYSCLLLILKSSSGWPKCPTALNNVLYPYRDIQCVNGRISFHM